jgi:hypothetical protein
MKVLALALLLCFLAAPDSCDSKQNQQVDLSAGMVPKASINRRQCSADHRFSNMSADSSDVDQGYGVKAIRVPAIPIKVGAQRRWRD